MTALFNKKVKAPAKEVKKVSVPAVSEKVAKELSTEKSSPQKQGGLDLTMVLVRPHITEKASDLSEKGVYAFEINKRANKMLVREAIMKLYKVTPVKIAIVMGKTKYMKNPRTGRVQMKKAGIKKALVYLKSGDKIEFV